MGDSQKARHALFDGLGDAHRSAFSVLPRESAVQLDGFLSRGTRSVPFFKPDGKPDMEHWRLFRAPTWHDAKAAAEKAILNSSVQDWRTDPARWIQAARNAAMDAGREEAWHAVREILYMKLERSAFDATNYARSIIVSDLEFEGKAEFIGYARSSWNVWEKGYYKAGDLNGKHIVLQKVEKVGRMRKLLRKGTRRGARQEQGHSRY